MLNFLQACREAIQAVRDGRQVVSVAVVVTPEAEPSRHPAITGYKVVNDGDEAWYTDYCVRTFIKDGDAVVEASGRYVLEDAWEPSPTGRLTSSQPEFQNLPGTLAAGLEMQMAKTGNKPGSLVGVMIDHIPGFQRPPVVNTRGSDRNAAGDVCVTRKVDKAPGVRPLCNCDRDPNRPNANDPANHSRFCAYVVDAPGVTVVLRDDHLDKIAAGHEVYGSWQIIFRTKVGDKVLDYCRETKPAYMSLEQVMRSAEAAIKSYKLLGAIIEWF